MIFFLVSKIIYAFWKQMSDVRVHDADSYIAAPSCAYAVAIRESVIDYFFAYVAPLVSAKSLEMALMFYLVQIGEFALI